MPQDRSRGLIQSVDRALSIIEAFRNGSDELGVTELGKRLGLHKSTTHGILTTLCSRGYVEQDPITGKYRLGIRLFEMGSLVLDRMDLQIQAGPILDGLREGFQETVHLVIADGLDVVYISKRESPRSVRIVSQVGRRLPCHCTGVGKVLLAALAPGDLDRLLGTGELKRFTQNTITDPKQLREELDRVRECGYAFDNEEIEEGLRCVAAPVSDMTGKAIAAISVAGPRSRMTLERMSGMAGTVKTAARDLSRRLGYRG